MWLAYSFVHSIEIPINRVVFIFCVLIIGAVSLGQRYKSVPTPGNLPSKRKKNANARGLARGGHGRSWN